MRNIKKNNKITKEILTIGPLDNPILSLKHSIILIRTHINSNNMKYNFYFEYYQKSNNKKEEYINIIFKKLSDFLILESKNNIDKSITSYEAMITHRIYYKDIIDIKRIFDSADIWFKDKELIMYKLDNRGQIIDLKEEFIERMEISFSKFDSGKYLSIQPGIIFDKDYIYPGVHLKTEKGLLGSITYDEFLLLKLSFNEYYNNWNLISTNLLQLAYLHSINPPDNENPINFN